jgi:hypothetical protein
LSGEGWLLLKKLKESGAPGGCTKRQHALDDMSVRSYTHMECCNEKIGKWKPDSLVRGTRRGSRDAVVRWPKRGLYTRYPRGPGGRRHQLEIKESSRTLAEDQRKVSRQGPDRLPIWFLLDQQRSMATTSNDVCKTTAVLAESISVPDPLSADRFSSAQCSRSRGVWALACVHVL